MCNLFSFYYSIAIIFCNVLFDGASIILKCQYFQLKKGTNDLTD